MHYNRKESKEFTVKLYESDEFNQILGDALRPGGLRLTRRVAIIAGIHENSEVLDIASGKGTTALFLSKEFGCGVTGVDLSQRLTSMARNKAKAEHLLGKVNFSVADAESLPFKDSSFDVVISECSFSLLPNKKRAAREFERVLRAGGKLVITDVILRGRIPKELQTQVAFASCISGAMQLKDYIELFEDVGFKNPYTEDHSEELKRISYQIITAYGAAKRFLSISTKSRSCSCLGEKDDMDKSVQAWPRLFKESRPGYALMAFTGP